MDIPLPSDDASKEGDKQGSELLSEKLEKNIVYKSKSGAGESRSRNSSKRDHGSSHQNWNRFGSNRDRNKNNNGRNSLSNYETGKLRNSTYSNRGSGYVANKEFQGGSRNFQTNLNHEYGSEGYNATSSSYEPINIQQNSTNFNPSLNTLNSIPSPSFGYGGMNSVNQCYDPPGMSNLTTTNNIPPNFNYGSQNLNAYNNSSHYSQLNPIVPPVINSYSYPEVNSINLPNNMSSMQPPVNINYNVGVQGMHPSNSTSNYSSYSSEGSVVSSTNLILPLPPLPPILPKAFDVKIKESVSEVPLPKQPPKLSIMPDTVPPPLSSNLTESSLDCKSSFKEVACASQNVKLSHTGDTVIEESKSIISDIIKCNPALRETVAQNKVAENSSYKPCENQELKLNIADTSCETEGNKIEKTAFENNEKETDKEAINIKKVKLSFPSNVKIGNVEKSFLEIDDSTSPSKKICNFPLLGKEEAKKRLRAFSASKLLVKEKTAKSSRINPLQDDHDDNESNGQTDHVNEDKKEISHKKKKVPEKTQIAEIKEREEKLKEILVNNTELFKNFDKDMTLANFPGLDFFDFSNLEKFEKKNNAVVKFFEGRREEEEKREGIEKGYSSSAGRDRNRKRDKKYSRSDGREGRHEESNKVKKCKSSQRKEVELPKSWSDVKDMKLKIEDLCNMLQYNKHTRSRSRSHSPSLDTESKNYNGRDKRKFPNDPFPYLPKNFKDFQALKRDEISPLSKDYNSYRQENFKKSYRGCNVQYTSTKPIVCYNIDSERYDYHYLSQKALKYKNSTDIMDIIFSFCNKSFDIQKLGRNMGSAKSRMWYPENWRIATREKNIEKERQNCANISKQKDDHSSKESSCNLNVDDEQNMITSESFSDSKPRNKKNKYNRYAVERKMLDNCDKKTDSDLDMHARFFTEENDEDEEEMVYEDDSRERLIETKKLLKESNPDSFAKNVSVTECADEKLYDELTSKSILLNEEYKSYLCSVDNKPLHKSKLKPTQLLETSFKDELNLKSRSKELVKENKSKISDDESARKAYIEVKAKLRDSKLNEKELQKLLKLKKELKLQKRLEKKMKKKPKKEKKEIKKKKDKKTKKALQEEIKISKKKDESLDDISPEQDMSEYEVIESENYDEESEDKNVGSETEKPEKGINLELSSNDHYSPCSILESSNVKLIQKEDEVPNSDHEEDRYSPSNISQYSEEGIDVDTRNMAMDLSSPIAASPSPQFNAPDSPSSLPYSPSNIFDEEEHAPSPYSPSSPQSSGSLSPPPFDESFKNKQGTILNSIPIPPKLNKLADNLSQLENSNDPLSDKNISSGELKEPSLSEMAVKGFQPVIFKLNLTRQTNAKLLQKPSLAGFDFDEEEEMENTKSPLPIPEMKDLTVLSSDTQKDKVLLPLNESKIEKHIDEIRKSEKDDLMSDYDNPRKRDSEKKMKRKSPSPRKSSRRRSRSRSRSPKEYKRKSYEKAVSRSPSRKEKCYRDSSPIGSNSYRKRERSRTPENYKRLSNRSPSASEKQRHVKSPNLEKVRDVYEKDLCFKRNSRSRTPSPVTKWKKVRSPPPKKFRHKSSYDHPEEPLSQYLYKKDMPMEDYSTTSSRNHSRSRERSPVYEAGTKHKADDNFYPSYNEEYSMPISSISNQYPRKHISTWDWESENNEHLYSSNHQNKPSLLSSNSPLCASLNERSKEDDDLEFEEDNHHASEFGTSLYWEFNSNQVPQQIAGSSQVIRVGNVLQVLPQEDSSLENASLTPIAPQEIMPPTLQETIQSTPIMSRKIVQAGNIIEVVPEGISEQEILNTNTDDQVGAVFKPGLVPPIPLPDKSLPPKSVVDKLSATKVLPERLSPDMNIYEHSISLKSLPENLPPLSNLQDIVLPRLETVPENLSPLKTSPDNLSSMPPPMSPVSTSAPMPVSKPNPMDIISALFTPPILRTEHNIEGSASSYSQIVSNQPTSSTMLNTTCFSSETFTSQENAMISNLDPLNSSSVELRTANTEPPLITSLESQQQAIFSAAVSAARGDTTSESALAQLISVIQQRHMAPATIDKLSMQLPMDQPMMNVDLEAFKQQKRERKERKQKEKELRQARRERRRIERENLEQKSKSNLSDDEDDILMKEAITEVPDLGSPVPEYEIYNEDDDEDEQEQENKAKPALVLLPPPEKGILILPNNNRNQNIAKIKSVSFADGVIPGDGTDVSGGEEIHSPPPPNTEPEKKKEKKLTKKKRVKVKPIKQFIFGNSRMDSPPPPPIIPPNGNVIKLYQGCSYASCTAPSTYVVYTQRPVEANAVDGGDIITGQVTIPPGMLFHAAALSRAFPQVEGIMPAFTSYPQVMDSPIVPI